VTPSIETEKIQTSAFEAHHIEADALWVLGAI